MKPASIALGWRYPTPVLMTLLATLGTMPLAAHSAESGGIASLLERSARLVTPLETRLRKAGEAVSTCQAATPPRDCKAVATEAQQLAAMLADLSGLMGRLAAALPVCQTAPTQGTTACATASFTSAVENLEAVVKEDVSTVLARAAQTPDDIASAKTAAEKGRAAASKAAADILTRLKDGAAEQHIRAVPGAVVAVESTTKALERATEAESHAKAVKATAELLAAQGLKLGRCTHTEGKGMDCPSGSDWSSLVAEALQLSRQLSESQAKLGAAVTEARSESWRARTSAQPPLQQARAMRFLELLEDNPDASALAGQDAASVSATTAGSTATLRFSSDRQGSTSLNRFNVTFSTPLDANKSRTTLWRRSADGLAGRPKVELSYTRLVLPGNDSWAFFAPGINLSSARQEVEYVNRSDLSALKTDRSSPLSLGAHLVLSRNAENAQLVSFRVERQRRSKPSDDTVTVCPAMPAAGSSFLNCLTGADGVPVRRYETVARIGYQRQAVSSYADLGLAVTHNARTDKTDVELPIYLVRSGTDTDKGKRNAGISLSWASKGGGWAIGVFVGTPFSLKSLNGAP